MKDYRFPTVEELLDAGVHFGHSVNKWNPKMEPYIFTAKQGVHILDLDETQKLLKEAGEFMYDVASKGGQIIFVATKKQIAQICAEEAKRCGAMYMSERWIGGTITNYKVIKKSIDKLNSLKKKRDAGELAMYTKKERLLIDREIAKLEKYFGGVVDLKGQPQAIFLVDAKREKTAVNECRIYNVPVVALIDTNSDPTGIAKLIPGNDDAAKSVTKVVKVLADCIEAGYKEYEKAKKEDIKKQETAKKEESKDIQEKLIPEDVIETATEAARVLKEAEKELEKELEISKSKDFIEEDVKESIKEGAKVKKVRQSKTKDEVVKPTTSKMKKNVTQVKKSLKKTKEE